MSKFHISQDETGFWQLAFEDDNGKLSLVSHQFTSPAHLIEDANDMVASGEFPNATIVIAPPRPQAAAMGESVSSDYKRPAPQRAE